MFNLRVTVDHQSADGPSRLSFTINNAPGQTLVEACTHQAEVFNAGLSKGRAMNVVTKGLVRVIPAHSVIQITVQPEDAD